MAVPDFRQGRRENGDWHQRSEAETCLYPLSREEIEELNDPVGGH